MSLPAPVWLPEVDLVLHAAAWTNVDGAEDDPQGAAIANIGGTQNVAAIGKPLVYYSTDYVFEGSKRTPYVESDGPSPQGAYGRTKLGGEAAALGSGVAWVLRSSWLFGWTSTNFVRTMLRLAAERDEVAVVDDQRGCPTYVGHLAAATRAVVDAGLPYGVYHLAAQGECTWADFAEAIFEEAGVACRVRPRRSSRRPAWPAAYGGSRPRSWGARRRGLPTRCSGASSRGRPCCRPGGTG